MPQFLCSQAHILAGWRLETQLTPCQFFSIIFDCHLKRHPQFYSESQLLDYWRVTIKQFVLAPGALRLKIRDFFQLNPCGHSPYVTSSLMRGQVCRLQLLLASPAQSFSGPSPVGLAIIFYCIICETFLFVASFDPQGYGGGIWPHLHIYSRVRDLFIEPRAPPRENILS
jgi:hypothetical protein